MLTGVEWSFSTKHLEGTKLVKIEQRVWKTNAMPISVVLHNSLLLVAAAFVVVVVTVVSTSLLSHGT